VCVDYSFCFSKHTGPHEIDMSLIPPIYVGKDGKTL